MTFYEAVFSYGQGGEPAGDQHLRQEIARWHDQLDGLMDQGQRQELASLVQAALGALGHKPSVMDWRRAARASALRVGTLVATDPLVALKRLLREEERLRSPSVRSFDDLAVAMETSADIREVVLFLLSEDYLNARRLLRGEEVALPAEPAPPVPEVPQPLQDSSEFDVMAISPEPAVLEVAQEEVTAQEEAPAPEEPVQSPEVEASAEA
jgi:hypothetical protein